MRCHHFTTAPSLPAATLSTHTEADTTKVNLWSRILFASVVANRNRSAVWARRVNYLVPCLEQRYEKTNYFLSIFVNNWKNQIISWCACQCILMCLLKVNYYREIEMYFGGRRSLVGLTDILAEMMFKVSLNVAGIASQNSTSAHTL